MRAWRWLGPGALLVALGAVSACEEPEAPVGPPRCEPEREHELDRKLKLAFKALALGETDEARNLFHAVLAEEPDHPEAQLGLRLSSGRQSIEPAPDAQEPAPGEAPPKGGARERGEVRHAVAVSGQWVPFGVAVDATRWRFEELRALAPLRRERDGGGVVHGYYRARHRDGRPTPVEDAARLSERVDLIVLHDTHTRTAREAVVELEGAGGSTHFIVDWDGAIYQVLDLAWEANHSQRAAIDARSVSIDLVNPVELGDAPGLPDEAEARGEHRPLSEFVVLQNDEVQQWGYTAAQIASLERLVRALGALLPGVPMRVPAEGGGVPRRALPEPDALDGVIGHLHVSRRAQDPGAGFPWEAFSAAIGRP